MNRITCILDACSIINLINIDEENFLVKKLSNIDYYLCQEVFKEVKNNVFTKLNNQRIRSELKSNEIDERKKEIDYTLNRFRTNQIFDYQIKKDLGDDFFDHVKNISGYSKLNGEFYSAALALYLSRCTPIDTDKYDFVPIKLFFHTDDYPAKRELTSFYLLQQIGYIEDTADLIVLLYRLDSNFTIKQLDKSLSDLYQEYAVEVSLLKKKLIGIRKKFSVQLLRNKKLMINLKELIESLSNLDFSDINRIKHFFYINKKKYRNINDAINLHISVFELETSSTNLLKKIKFLRKDLLNIYRI